MADDRKKAAKSETLTIRLDQKTRFMLEFMARLRGQSLTTVVERAIVDAANNATIEIQGYPRNQIKKWTDFWDIEDGVRTLKIAAEQALYPTYDEEIALDFARAHYDFFFRETYNQPNRAYIRVLWPRIKEFLEIWTKTKSTDYFAAGRAMKEALRQNNIASPEWPPQAAKKEEEGDLGDEIPF